MVADQWWMVRRWMVRRWMVRRCWLSTTTPRIGRSRAAILEGEGYHVILAEDGETGVAAFERARPQCILLDIRMPGMDGITACRKIRELPGGADVAIVFVTAQHDVETFDRTVVAGGDDFVTKPFQPSELAVRVRIALKLRRITHDRSELGELIKRQRNDLQRIQFQIRDANETLVIASVHAQQLTDEANAARAAAHATRNGSGRSS